MSAANKSRRVFDKSFKQNAVRMVLDEGLTCEEVALKLDIGRTALYRWVKDYRAEPETAFPGKGKHRVPAEEEVARLRRELKATQEERDVLKKALLIFTRPSSEGSGS